MPDPAPARYRFGVFEADAASGELRRQGIRLKLNAQPFQLLLLLLERPGELVTREAIERELWLDGTMVDFDHGVNSAVNRIREALGDTATNPRFVETLARRGYRFIAPVERIAPSGEENSRSPAESAVETSPSSQESVLPAGAGPRPAFNRLLATPQDLPRTPHAVVLTLFLLLQVMYVGFYVGALANLAEIAQIFAPLRHPDLTLGVLVVSAAILIPARAFVFCAALFHAPQARRNLLRLWPALLIFDELWALSPFLLMHHIDLGPALAAMALLVYSPFAQRSLVLMGAGDPPALP